MTPTKLLRLALATLLAFAFTTELAHAGPLVGVLGTAFTALGASTGVAQFLVGVVSFGLQSLLAKMMAPDEKRKGIREKLESGGDNPLSFIMGTCATAGKLVYVNQGGNSLDNMLALVISVSELPVTGLGSHIWINGELCNIDFERGPGDPDDWIPPSDYHPVVEYDKKDKPKYEHEYCWIRFYDGTQTEADPWLIEQFGADENKPWTADMIGRGCAYAIVVCRYSAKGVWSGVPTFKFEIDGIPLYDVSKDSTAGGSGPHRWGNKSTWESSSNPNVQKYNLIRGITYGDDWIYGGQDVSEYQLPASYWIAAIAHCNENVTNANGDHLKRYTSNFELSVDQQPIDIIKEIDKACAGFTAESGGIWKTWCGAPGTSVWSFTDDDIFITEEQTDTLFAAETVYNGCRATYTKPEEGWVSKECAPRIIDELVAKDDNISNIASLQLPYVTEGNQAQRLMRLATLDSRRQITHLLVFPPIAKSFEPFDVFNWNSDRNGYVNKKFQVRQCDYLPNGNVSVLLREISPSDYDWDVSYELPEPVGTISPVKPGALALDFTVSATQINRPGGGKDKPAIKVEWDWGLPDIDLKYVKWEVRRSSSDTDVIAHGTFHNVEESSRKLVHHSFKFGQTLQVRLFAQPDQLWRESSWTTWKDVTLIDLDVPVAPTLTAHSDLSDDGSQVFYFDVDWTAIDADVDYTIKIVSGGKTYYRRADENTYRYEGAQSGKTYVVSVRANGEGKTRGSWSSTTSITISKKSISPTTPSGLTADGDNHRVVLTWDKSPDKDYKQTVIYRASTNNFASASEVGRTHGTRFKDDKLANGATRYYWITHIDRTDNESAKYPTSNTGGVSATTTRVTDDDTDGTAYGAPTIATPTVVIRRQNDGKIKHVIKLSCTAPAGVTGKEHYGWEVDNGVDPVYIKKSDGTTTQIPGEVGLTYTFRVRAVSFNGVKGTFSSTTSVTPVKKSNDLPTPGSLSIASNHKRNKIDWTDIDDDTYPDYRNTAIYRNTVNTTPTPGTTGIFKRTKAGYYVDDNLTPGAVYYYWVSHRDSSGNFSTLAGPVSSAATKIVAGDYTAGSIVDSDTDDTAPSAVAAPTLTLRQRVDGDGTYISKVKITWSAPSSSVPIKGYEVKIDDGTDIEYVKTKNLSHVIKSAVVGLTYTVTISAISKFGAPSAFTNSSTITITGKSSYGASASISLPSPIQFGFIVQWTAPTNADYHHTEIALSAGSSPSTSNIVATSQQTPAVVFWPSAAAVYVSVRHVDTSGNVTSWSTYPISQSISAVSYIASNSVDIAQLTSNVFRDGISAMSVGALGTYAFLKKTDAGTANAGDTKSGANLVYTDDSLGGATNPSGTWQCMGRCASGQATMWLRVS